MRGHITEGRFKKGGVNPANHDAPRPPPPGGSKPRMKHSFGPDGYIIPTTERDKRLKAWGDSRKGGKPQMKQDWDRLCEIFDEVPELTPQEFPALLALMEVMEENLIMYGTGETAPLGIVLISEAAT